MDFCGYVSLPHLSFWGVSGVSTALACSLDPLGLPVLGTALGRAVVVSQPHMDELSWGSTARGVPAFNPVDGWGGEDVFLFQEDSCNSLGSGLQQSGTKGWLWVWKRWFDT